MQRLKALLFISALLAAPAWAQDTDSKAHRHLGFYLHVDSSVDAYHSQATGSSLVLSGAALSVNLAVGGALFENFILAARFWVTDPLSIHTSNGDPFGLTNSNSQFSGFGAGLEAKYYFMPINLFISGMVGLGSIALSNPAPSGPTPVGSNSAGAIIQLSFGKEWWVARHVGVGVAAQASYVPCYDANLPGTWNYLAGGLALTGTYN